MTSELLQEAIGKAISGDWEAAHRIVQQDEADPTACWVHAVLHKIEGDAANSRYWYTRAGKSYQDHADPVAELKIILGGLENRAAP